ncbi:MAG TPA: response regulator [Candidatus Saccharimonadia bacterium]|nr:response regulator [Candidatus Saccharimonadia bacterium]
MNAPTDGLVCVVDDDGSVRRSLERLIRSWRLRVETFASAKAYLASLEKAAHEGPSCLVLDVCMPGLDGIHLQQALRDKGVPIIFLTGHGDVPTCATAMKAGAVDFLTKPVEDELLMAAVGTALRSSLAVQKAAQDQTAARARFETLTAREAEVMTCVIAGMLNKQIADHLGAAEKTIKVHRGRVMEKMNVYSVADLVRSAQAIGLKPCASPPRA